MQGWPTGGRCRFCRCTQREPCPGNCGWVDREQRLCTACAHIAEIWAAGKTRPPNMARAFFRGFASGSNDARATEYTNPYLLGGVTARFWDLGNTAGVTWAR